MTLVSIRGFVCPSVGPSIGPSIEVIEFKSGEVSVLNTLISKGMPKYSASPFWKILSK